jgi:tRNA (guanine-N7-)-methyltransferase
MARVGPHWLLDESGPVLDIPALTGGRDAVLEIGIGKGEALIAMAAADPDVVAIGCDVHTPGIAASLAEIEQRELVNVRLVHGDALVFVERVGPDALAGVRIYFPDPWPKPRQHHRRLVRPDVVACLVDRVRVGGFVHLATDIDDYAAQMRRVCDDEPRLHGGAIDRPGWRPVTRYEQRGELAGRTATDLWYTRVR